MDPAPDEEIAEAEVVEKSIEEQAAEVTARIMEKMRAEETEAGAFGVGSLEPRAGGCDIDDPAGSTVRYGPQRWS